MRIDVLTLFPELLTGVFDHSIVRRARDAGLVEIVVTNIRDYAAAPHYKTDDRPFGGGPGMVMMCEPVFAAVEAVERTGPPARRILTSPAGRRLDQALVAEMALAPRLLILCGRYEGVDDRIAVGLKFEEVSIGDYVLSGGEPAAAVLVDAVVRLIPGALGNPAGTADESFSAGLLEYPQYTRPRVFRGMETPEVLLSGDHAEIARRRHELAVQRTRERRADLAGDSEKKKSSDPPPGGPPEAQGRESS